MEWFGRVTDVEGDIFTVIVTPTDHDGPELIADYSMSRCGITIEVGDELIVTPYSVTKRPPVVWTKDELAAIMRRARQRSRMLNAMAE